MDADHRAVLRQFLQRDAVVTAARIGRLDLATVEAGIASLEGTELARAAQQAQAIDQHLQDGRIAIQATTVIIVLLFLLIILIAT